MDPRKLTGELEKKIREGNDLLFVIEPTAPNSVVEHYRGRIEATQEILDYIKNEYRIGDQETKGKD